MNVDLVNPFVTAAFNVLEMVLTQSPGRGQIAVQSDGLTAQQLNVHCGIAGEVVGHVIYGMSLQTADRIASTMTGQTVKIFDQLAASAIAELGNMISGNALLGLYECGIKADVTPPTIIRGTRVQISSTSIPSIVVPFVLDHGDFFLTIALQRVK